MKKEIITGLDIGSTKVRAVIAERLDRKKFRLLGAGEAPCDGLMKGEVVNIVSTSEAIKLALKEAERTAEIEAENIVTGVSGENINSIRSRNYVNITNDDGVVTVDDLRRLKADLRNISFSKDMMILHILHEEFFVDRQGSVSKPLGIACSRLEAANYIVMASSDSIQNIRKATKKAGYEVNDLKLQSLASASAVLEPAEKDLGVLLIDLGSGTTNVLTYHNNAIRFSRVFGIGGHRVSLDIKEFLSVVAEDAERLKVEFGYATETSIVKDELIQINGVGPRPSTKIPTSLLTQIIKSRLLELFKLINTELEKADVKNKIRTGVVITGGGALMKGITDLAEQVFGLPARMGLPVEEYFDGELRNLAQPEYASLLGLLLPVEEDFIATDDEEEKPVKKSGGLWGRKSETKTKKSAPDKKKGKFGDFLKKVKNQFDDL